MAQVFVSVTLACLLSTAALAQSNETRATFSAADVHVSPRIANAFFRILRRGERYEVHNATMVDLIRTAYSVDADKVVGGPSWLEFDRFDITALVAPNASQDSIKPMVQALLADRFKLELHDDTIPQPGYVLSLGKAKHRLKEAESSDKTGCQFQPIQAPRPSAPTPGQFLVPMIGFSCHNMTMEAFAIELKGAPGGGYVTNAVVDSTGLKGSWDFDLKFTSKGLLPIAGSDGVTLADAIDKQLGLKLDEQKLPTKVIVVDKVNETPTANPPDLAEKLPPPPPAEFEVAEIKLSDPNAPLQAIVAGGIGVQPGGRVNLPGLLTPLKQLISIAWNLASADDIAGAPKSMDSARFDIIAKLPPGFVTASGLPPSVQDLGPMLQALLVDRFKLKFHFEDRPVTAYTLVAAKPKLKKADPSTRTGCKMGQGPPANTGPIVLPSRLVTCQNMTMAQFAGQLQSMAGPYVHYPVVDGTAIDGGWDFSFSYSPIPAGQLAGLRGAPSTGAPDAIGASDPIGGTSLFDAVEKQLGLKLEPQKRQYPLFVIDHIEEKPTDN